MIRRDHSAVVGLCASLMVHGLFAAALVGVYVHEMDGQRWWPAITEHAQADGMIWRDGEFGESNGRGEG